MIVNDVPYVTVELLTQPLSFTVAFGLLAGKMAAEHFTGVQFVLLASQGHAHVTVADRAPDPPNRVP
jgi:hypothetical protein